MAEWKQVGNKLVYMFGALQGWTPNADVISSVMGGVYNCQNVRFEDGKVKTRGGWTEFSTGDSAIKGLMAWNDSSGSNIVSTEDNDLRKYATDQTGDPAWEDLSNEDSAFGKTEFALIPTSSGKAAVVASDGINYNIIWDQENKVREIGSTKIADMTTDEAWTNATTNTTSSLIRRGVESQLITQTGAGTTAAVYSVGSTSVSASKASSISADARAGDYLGTEAQCASKVVISSEYTFDTVDFYYYPVGTPSSLDYIFVRLETDNGGVPSGTLIDANAHGVFNVTSFTSSKKLGTVTLQASVTWSSSFWVVFGVCTESAASGDGTYTWQTAPSSDAHYLYGHSETTVNSAFRSDASDPQLDTWDNTYSSFQAYTRLYEAGTGTLSVGGADLSDGTSQGDGEVWITLQVDDVSDWDDTNSLITFTDSAAKTAYHAISMTGWSDATWRTVKLTKSAFTESAADFDWTDIVSVTLTIGATTGEVNAYVDQIRFVYALIDDTGTTGAALRPPIAGLCEASPSGDRLILANTDDNVDNSGPNFLWYSDSYNPHSFTSTQYISFPREITGIKSQGGIVHVFARDMRWVMVPNYASSDFSSSAIDWKIQIGNGPGTVSHRSIVSGTYNNEHGVFYLADDGVYFAKGLDYIKVSGAIDILWEQKSAGSVDSDTSNDAPFFDKSFKESTWQNACAIWFRDRYYLFYEPQAQSDNSASSDNEQCIMLNTKTGNWEMDYLGAAVFPNDITMWTDSNGIPYIMVGCANGEFYQYIHSRATTTDDTSAFESSFHTCFIGTELMEEVDWETLNIWVKSESTSATSLKVLIYTIEDYDDTASYDEWEEDPDTAIATITTAWTPNTAFKWHRLRIKLDDNTNNVYPRSRAISLQIYDDNDTALDYYLESLICTPLHDELR